MARTFVTMVWFVTHKAQLNEQPVPWRLLVGILLVLFVALLGTATSFLVRAHAPVVGTDWTTGWMWGAIASATLFAGFTWSIGSKHTPRVGGRTPPRTVTRLLSTPSYYVLGICVLLALMTIGLTETFAHNAGDQIGWRIALYGGVLLVFVVAWKMFDEYAYIERLRAEHAVQQLEHGMNIVEVSTNPPTPPPSGSSRLRSAEHIVQIAMDPPAPPPPHREV